MNAFLTVLLCVVALLASGAAIAAGTNEAAAVGAAAVAVGAAGLLLVDIVGRTRWPQGRPLPVLSADPGRVRSSLEAGTRGRSSLVELLDTLEWRAGNPDRTRATVEELERIRALPPQEFREYLSSRVSDLERRT